MACVNNDKYSSIKVVLYIFLHYIWERNYYGLKIRLISVLGIRLKGIVTQNILNQRLIHVFTHFIRSLMLYFDKASCKKIKNPENDFRF